MSDHVATMVVAAPELELRFPCVRSKVGGFEEGVEYACGSALELTLQNLFDSVRNYEAVIAVLVPLVRHMGGTSAEDQARMADRALRNQVIDTGAPLPRPDPFKSRWPP